MQNDKNRAKTHAKHNKMALELEWHLSSVSLLGTIYKSDRKWKMSCAYKILPRGTLILRRTIRRAIWVFIMEHGKLFPL